MFGDTKETDETPMLKARLEGYERMSEIYLGAVSSLDCMELEYPQGSGKRLKPSELPTEVINHFEKIRDDGWKEERKVEEWLATQPALALDAPQEAIESDKSGAAHQ